MIDFGSPTYFDIKSSILVSALKLNLTNSYFSFINLLIYWLATSVVLVLAVPVFPSKITGFPVNI